MSAPSSPPHSKRKLEDYVAATDEVNQQNDAVLWTINPATRMRKDENALVLPPPHKTHRPGLIQFFVRTFLNKTLVVHADPFDTVRSVHEKIQSITNISAIAQGLIYRGKQLQWERTLIECGVENDANLYLVARMRSTGYPRAWQLINDVVSLVFDLLNNTTNTDVTHSVITNCDTYREDRSVKSMLEEYLLIPQSNNPDQTSGYLEVFHESSVAAALVMLYVSSLNRNKAMAEEAIMYFVGTAKIDFLTTNYDIFVPIVLEFCKLLRTQAGVDDSLYKHCRKNLGFMLSECTDIAWNQMGTFLVKEIFPFVNELAGKLLHDLSNLPLNGPESEDVKALGLFLVRLRKEIEESVVLFNGGPIRMPLCREVVRSIPVFFPEEVTALYDIFLDLLDKMDSSLKSVDEHMVRKLNKENVVIISGCNQYLSILKELHGISKLYHNADKEFGEVLKLRKSALNYLVVNRAKRGDDNEWILQFKELTDFETRRCLAMMVLPDLKDEYDESLEMLIDRSQLLSESFEYITRAQPQSLRSGLFMEFKNEEATGPGVLREWFFLVCQAIFDPQKALFVACPNDRRRFYPNPASKVDPLHLQYFKFSGRVIALALVHKIQVGIVFDRVFFAQLSGDCITLEDIRDADPYLYNSCKQILDMDPEAVDQDVLGLTFVHEIEELGNRKVIELAPDGKNITVNSKNRKLYIDVLIHHKFALSVSDQVDNFAQGFADIASSNQLQRSFFRCLNSGDLDMMLHGSEKPICVDDWRAHTEYNGFKQSDSQISWFWKIVKSMTPEQRKVLLFFWTSIKYLPVEGFKGLASRLHIYKSSGSSSNHLPTSHTCFYRLCLPSYASFPYMRERLHIITQEHVGCSFGTF